MITIYSSKINKNLDSNTYEYLLHYVSQESRDRIKKFHFKEDSLRSLYGEIIVRYLITNQLGVKNDTIHIERNSFGKPYIVNSPLHFNISHAGDWVVCALSSSEVGIDIEYIKNIDYNIAKRFFSTYEYEALMKLNDSEKLAFFYTLWTLKESYIKWLGTGLSTPLDSFSFKVSKEKIILIDEEHRKIPHFKQHFIDNNYKLSVCSMFPSLAEKINEIDIENIFLD